MTGRCRLPECPEDRPEGPYAVFCPTHHFMLPHKETAFLVRWQIKCARCPDEDIQQHMREQLHGYINAAVRKLQSQAAH